MAYLEGSALDRAELLEALLVFLDANGWSRSGNEITNSLGTKFSFNITANANRAQLPSGIAVDNSFGARISQEEHGGAAGTWSAYFYSNDFTGPFAATYFFTDGITCALVVKSSNLRYSHFVFGHVDKHDLYAGVVPFVCGMYHEWWWRISDYSDYDSGFNYIYSGRHGIGYFGENGQCAALVPDGVLDPTLGFTDGLHYPDWHNTSHHYAFVSNSYDSGNVGQSFMLDYFTGVANQAMTGGVPLHGLPVIADAGVLCYLGEIALTRLVNIQGLSPGQVISFAGDDWVVFPLKQQGDYNSQGGGATPLPVTNSGMYGLAFKK